jgi:hypothetical protein
MAAVRQDKRQDVAARSVYECHDYIFDQSELCAHKFKVTMMSESIELSISTTFRAVVYEGESPLWYSMYKREFKQSVIKQPKCSTRGILNIKS